MFPLHPLTVEDVLQQEPREKVDVFERLGYYFVVTRAIDERYFRYTSGSASGSSKSLASDAEGVDEEKHVNVDVLEKGAKEDSFEMREFGSEKSGTNVTIGGGAGAGIADGRALDSGTQKPNGRARVDIIEGVGGKEGLEGVSVGAINVYLIVFAHGVISFHFEDIAKHTDKVRRRLLDVSQPVELTSDWIAHGILDSIVDAFFPLISYVEIEVEEIEQSANEPLPMWRSKKRGKKASDEDSHGEIVSVATVQDGDPVDTESLPTIMFEVKRRRMRPVLRPLPRVPLARGVARLLPRFMVAERQVTSVKRQSADPSLSPNFFTPNRVDTGALNPGDRAFESQAALDQGAMLMRITAMRKIVTGLSRLLVPKNDFVRGLRKRLVDANAAWIGDGGTAMSRTEVSIYMGDVHDHIVTMLQNLRNGDTRLTDIHASYLAQVNHNDRKVKQGTDKVLVVLATVTVTALSSQCFTSLWGINAHTPRNVHGSHTFTYFFIVVAGVVFIISAILTFVYVITKRAKRKTELRRAAR